MKKKVKKTLLERLLEFKFDYSLIMVLLAALILLISFLLYEYKTIEYNPTIVEENVFGSECTVDMDCPQPRCPGIKGMCESGYCIIKQIGALSTKCIDLQTTLCGNNICEAEEKNTCPEDC